MPGVGGGGGVCRLWGGFGELGVVGCWVGRAEGVGSSVKGGRERLTGWGVGHGENAETEKVTSAITWGGGGGGGGAQGGEGVVLQGQGSFLVEYAGEVSLCCLCCMLVWECCGMVQEGRESCTRRKGVSVRKRRGVGSEKAGAGRGALCRGVGGREFLLAAPGAVCVGGAVGVGVQLRARDEERRCRVGYGRWAGCTGARLVTLCVLQPLFVERLAVC